MYCSGEIGSPIDSPLRSVRITLAFFALVMLFMRYVSEHCDFEVTSSR